MNLLDRNAVRATATCDDAKPSCFASVMPESPQTMISLVANYAAGITTLPRKTGLHYCRAATQNILWCQEMPATELFSWAVSWKQFACSWISSTLSTRPNKYFREDISESIHQDLIKILPLSHQI